MLHPHFQLLLGVGLLRAQLPPALRPGRLVNRTPRFGARGHIEASTEATRPVVVARETLESRARDWLEYAGLSAYPTVKHNYAFDAYPKGAYTTALYAEYLLRLHRLTAESDYLDWALFTVDLLLGANPQGRSYVSGLGSNAAQNVLMTALPEGAALPNYGPCQSEACEDAPSEALRAAQTMVYPD